MYAVFDNVATSTRADCCQLFFIFSGLMRKIGGLSPLDFLNEACLSDRNVVMFRDPYKTGYRRGLSEQIADLDALVNWQHEYCRTLPHVRDVYCVGVSGGALPAMYAGYHLKAKGVWSFGARPPAPEIWGLDPEALLFKQHSLRREQGLARGNPHNETALDPFEECMLDTAIIDTVRNLLSTPNGITEYRLYYSPSNKCDTLVHDVLSDLPGTISCPVTASPDYPYAKGPNWDHKVLPILHHQQALPTLFPPLARV